MNKRKVRKWILSAFKTLAVFSIVAIAANWFQSRNIKSPSDLTCLDQISVRTLDEKQVAAREVILPHSLIYFWAPWCGVCKLTAPGLTEFMKDRESHFVAIGLDDDETARFQAFAQESRLPVDKTFIGDEALRDCIGVSAYPTYYIVGKSGERSLTSVGFTFKFMLWIKLQIAKVI